MEITDQEPEGGDQIVPEGGDLYLFCKATGRPTPDIFWNKVPTDGSSEVKHNGPTWNFTNIHVTDSGTYSCVADNKVEGPKRGQEVNVTVTGKYIFLSCFIPVKGSTDGKFDSFGQFHSDSRNLEKFSFEKNCLLCL